MDTPQFTKKLNCIHLIIDSFIEITKFCDKHNDANAKG